MSEYVLSAHQKKTLKNKEVLSLNKILGPKKPSISKAMSNLILSI